MDTIRSDQTHTGKQVFTNTVSLPKDTVGNSQFSSSDPLEEEKQEHRIHSRYQQNGTATTETVVLHWAYAAGATLDVAIGSIAACIGDATVTVDVKKNGTTILSSVVTLDNANAAYTAEMGTVSVSAIASGDVLTAVITATAGTGTLATGLYVDLISQEDSA